MKGMGIQAGKNKNQA